MKRRDFILGSAAAAGAGLVPLELLAQSDRRKELLIVANETGPNSLDIHTVGANRPAYGVSWICYDRLMTFGKKKGPNGVPMYDYTKLEPELAESWTLASDGMSVTFKLRKDARFHDGTPASAKDVKCRRSRLHAVDDVSFTIGEGENVGLVGESGCGKSTLARLVTRTLDPTGGDLIFRGRNIAFIPARAFAGTPLRPKIQMVFQDANDSLDPRCTAFAAIAEPAILLLKLRGRELDSAVQEAARQVGLAQELLGRFPHQLSGGQKARVGIARAIVTRPELLVLDEPTAALDVSVQATILQLLAELKASLGMSYLFVSHDLNVVRMLCDRVIVMYLGKIVEQGPAAELFCAPRHPYTQALVAAIPAIGGPREKSVLAGEPRSPVDPAPHVCRFFGRCPRQAERCRTEAPVLYNVGPGHEAACHFAHASW